MLISHRARSYTSESLRKQIKLPERQQTLEHRKQLLLRFHRRSNQQRRGQIQSQKKPGTRETMQTSWRYNETSESGRGFSHRIKSSGLISKKVAVTISLRRQNQDLRPSTSITNLIHSVRGNSTNDLYPLEILNSMERKSHKQLNSSLSNQPFNIKKMSNFLKKGKALKQAIILNILRSKTNKTVAQSGSNYSGCKANAEYVHLIKSQIPTELRDVIGTEEMFRMNNIFTGGTFKCDDLYSKVNDLIDQRNSHRTEKRRKKSPTNHEHGDTLRSMKRWDHQ